MGDHSGSFKESLFFKLGLSFKIAKSIAVPAMANKNEYLMAPACPPGIAKQTDTGPFSKATRPNYCVELLRMIQQKWLVNLPASRCNVCVWTLVKLLG